MANPANKADLTKRFSDFLTEAISDGTYADILSVLKTDKIGEAAVASQIKEYIAQLWTNLSDDFIATVWNALEGRVEYTAQTVDAGSSLIDVIDGVVDGEQVAYTAWVFGQAVADADRYFRQIDVAGYVYGGTKRFHHTTNGTEYHEGALSTCSAFGDIGISPPFKYQIQVGGQVGKTIDWTIAAVNLRRIGRP